MFNDPEWASKEEWDAYAWFGFAISEAQMMEMQLQVIATAFAMQAGASDNHENRWFRLYDGLGRLTLGQLIEKVKPHDVLSQVVVQMLYEAKVKRNALAHSFWRPQEAQASITGTTMIAIEEFQKAASLFRHVTTRLDPVVHEMLDKLHVSRAQAEIQLEQLRNENAPDRSIG